MVPENQAGIPEGAGAVVIANSFGALNDGRWRFSPFSG